MSPSGSEPNSGSVTAVCSVTVTLRLIAVGASFTGVMVMATVATGESLQPSVTLNVNKSEVAVSLLEVYVTTLPESVAVPAPGFETSENIRKSPSGSEPVSAIIAAVCSIAVAV